MADKMRFCFRLSLWLELVLAGSSLFWVCYHTTWVLTPRGEFTEAMRAYAIEAIILSALVLWALVAQFFSGKPQLELLWFALGMGAGLVALLTLYLGWEPLKVLALAFAAGILAVVRTGSHWPRLLLSLVAGVIAQAIFMGLIIVIGLAIISYINS